MKSGALSRWTETPPSAMGRFATLFEHACRTFTQPSRTGLNSSQDRPRRRATSPTIVENAADLCSHCRLGADVWQPSLDQGMHLRQAMQPLPDWS